MRSARSLSLPKDYVYHANNLVFHDEHNDYWPAFEKLFIKLDRECEEP